MDLMERLGACGGIARRSELVHCAADRREVAALLKTEELRAFAGGWIAARSTAEPTVAARLLNATITCVSAAEWYELPVVREASRPHLAVPRSRGAHRGRLAQEPRIHREPRWSPPASQSAPVAPPAEVLARALRCLPAAEAVVMVDSALNRRLVDVADIAAMLAGPGATSALATLDRCDARSRSVIETLARLALEDSGLEPRAGVVIDGVGEVDLLVAGWIVIECDGFAYHSGRQAYRNDRFRDRSLAARGYVVLRFTWEEIVNRPQCVVEAVRRVLAR